ncbi:MAG TPA: hypothetical protein IGS53_12825 [Leptolyngbyaceae cyanobacterium M33_DOE_097]|uniref:Uncharacterized protein n=1 Tax=Oscillatoriales cyanobacterium SpSt-418 TaxID=2282169 RepID=A0A7C3KC12_9CYAN|nr:hypothetical protein [Leptolyngbyaceae cyanobacterium M33_DOE_097]
MFLEIKFMLKQIRRIFSAFLMVLVVSVFLSFTLSPPAFASVHFDFALPSQLHKILSNKRLVAEARKILDATPEAVCTAYFNHLDGIDGSEWKALEKGATSAFTITQAITSASSAGAGSLAGYAGISSAVSQMGLGGLTTALAGMMGSSATGAAATAVVTSAVGGPIVMGALLAGGTGAAVFGTYEAGKFATEKLGDWAANVCSKEQNIRE